MDIYSTEILLGVVALLLFLYYYLTADYDFWKKRNVQGPRPIPIFGNYKDVILGKVHAADYVKKLCETYSEEPAIGIFFRKTPVLIVKDLEMLNEVLIGSFQISLIVGSKFTQTWTRSHSILRIWNIKGGEYGVKRLAQFSRLES